MTLEELLLLVAGDLGVAGELLGVGEQDHGLRGAETGEHAGHRGGHGGRVVRGLVTEHAAHRAEAAAGGRDVGTEDCGDQGQSGEQERQRQHCYCRVLHFFIQREIV